MKLVLPIAGKGTRVKPLTHSVHKSLLPIVNKPVTAHLIDMVLNTQGVEVTEIIFITGYFEQQIIDWAEKAYPDIDKQYVTQEVQNGTAHAIKLAQDAVGDEDMLVIFPDALIDADLEVIAEDTEVDGMIWCMRVDDPQNYGIVTHDEDHLVTGIVEKPEEPTSDFANIGMYYVRDSKSVFSMIDMLYEHEMKQKGEYAFPEALDLMAQNGKDIRVHPVEGWYDCGTLAKALKTNKIFCERAEIENLSTVAEGAVIERSTLFNCIVLDNARISDCDLENSIIGPKSIVKHTKGQVFCGSDCHIVGNDNQ